MSRSTPAVLLLPLLLATGSALAHETIPSSWCPTGTTPVILGTFSFRPEQLQAYREEQERLCAQNRTCGIIDDWFWANDISTTYCGTSGLQRSQAPEEAIPFVSSPRSFNALDHHDAYSFEQGSLDGQCVVCRSSTVTPVPAYPEMADH